MYADNAAIFIRGQPKKDVDNTIKLPYLFRETTCLKTELQKTSVAAIS